MSAEHGSSPEIVDEALAREILAMVAEDRRMRSSGVMDPEVDHRNTARMREIVDQYGWPTRSLVGHAASQGAWLLVQHADHDPDFQWRALDLLNAAVQQGEAEPSQAAFLIDRVRMGSGEPQVYGTQCFRDADGVIQPRPIEDPDQLDARRASVGLEPFEKYAEYIRTHGTSPLVRPCACRCSPSPWRFRGIMPGISYC